MQNRAEENWNEMGSSDDAKELFNHKQKTYYDGVKELWSSVLFLAAEYATGKVTNDHDCGNNPEIKRRFRESSVRFLCGQGNFDLACEAAGIDAGTIKRLGKQCKG